MLPDWWGFPSGAGHWYRGRYLDVPIFDHPQLPKGEVLIVDLSHVGEWNDVIAAGTDSPAIEIDEPPIAQGATAEPAVFITATHRYAFEPQSAERVGGSASRSAPTIRERS